MEGILIIGAMMAFFGFIINSILKAHNREDERKRLIAEQEIIRIDKYKIDPKLIPRYLIIAYHKEIEKSWLFYDKLKILKILESIKKIDKRLSVLQTKSKVPILSNIVREVKKEVINYNIQDLDIDHVDWSKLKKIKVTFHDNGNLKFRQLRSKNNNIVYTCEWYDNGKPKRISDTKIFKKTEKICNSDGQMIRKQNFYYDVLDGEQNWWYPDGKKRGIENRLNGRLNGPKKTWDLNGNAVVDCNFVDNRLNGKFIRYTDHFGHLEANYSEGLLNGELKIYNNLGVNIQIFSYKNNQLDGSSVIFNSDRVKQIELLYRKNKIVYNYKWYDTGILKEKGGVLNGKKNGDWAYYGKSGEIIKEEKFPLISSEEIGDEFVMPFEVPNVISNKSNQFFSYDEDGKIILKSYTIKNRNPS